MKPRLIRYGLRASSPPMSITATRAAMQSAHRALRESDWTDLGEDASDLPPHKYKQGGPQLTYDAFAYGGDYEADDTTAVQRAYLGAVCYTARVGGAFSSLRLTAYGDRWLSQGAILDLFLSDDPQPPPFALVEDGSVVPVATTGDPAPAGAAGAAYPPPFQRVARSNSGADSQCEIELAPPEGAAGEYAHIVLRLADYESTRLTDTGAVDAWIEGSAAIVGASVEFVGAAGGAEAPTVAPCDDGGVSLETYAAYLYLPYAYKSFTPRELVLDGDSMYAFPRAAILRARRPNLAYPDAGPYLIPGEYGGCGIGHMRSLLFVGDSYARHFERAGMVSYIIMQTVRTRGRRLTSWDISFSPTIVPDPALYHGDLDGDEICVRMDLYALPWPLLSFWPNTDASEDDRVCRCVDHLALETLADPAFLQGCALGLSFIADRRFLDDRAAVEYSADGRAARREGANYSLSAGLARPLYMSLPYVFHESDAGSEAQAIPLEANMPFDVSTFPCAPVVSREFLLRTPTSDDDHEFRVEFPVPLDTDEKTVFLAHFRIVADRSRITHEAVPYERTPSGHQQTTYPYAWVGVDYGSFRAG